MTLSPDRPDPMTCDGFLELLPDLLDGDLTGPALASAVAHRESCAECAAMVAELELVSRSAAALPELRPSRDLWAGIAARIEAPVVPLATTGVATMPTWYRRPWLAAAAAVLLVAGTAAVTRQLTLRGMAPAAEGTQVALDAPRPVAPSPAAPSPDAAPATSVGTVGEPLAPAAPTGGTGEAPAAASRPAMQLASAPGSALEVATAYDQEVLALRTALDLRRDGLDSATVTVLETNLAIIDRAIAESREALLRDPGSAYLSERLSGALQDKLQLMRTAVLLSNDD